MNPLELKFLKPAVISDNNGQPFAADYADVYFNDLNGLDETNHVFIEGNHLLDRWLMNRNESNFCIGETGFGSGMNFLATCLAWQNCENKPNHLHFISTELHPMKTEDMKSAHGLFPEVAQLSQKLMKHYGSFRSGVHQYRIDNQITLTLMMGDAAACFKQLVAKVDAWFLDGFTPSRNPNMWSPELFNAMANLSKADTTLATYSAAGLVKNGLTQAGFKLTKQTGFGPKRHMLVGTFQNQLNKPTNKQLWHPTPTGLLPHKKVTILGGGIAGLSLARSFSLAGFHTTVVEQNQQPLKQASGHGYAMVMPMITAKNSPEALFYLRAFEHARKQYNGHVFQPTGVVELFDQHKAKKRIKTLKNLFLPKQLITCNKATINYPGAGFVDTQALSNDWLPYVDQWVRAEVKSIEHCGEWSLQDVNQQCIHQCDLLIIAAGMGSLPLVKTHQHLNLTAKLGQTHQVQTSKSLNLSQILMNQGYLIPVNETEQGGHYLLGATFDHLNESAWYQTDFSEVDHWDRNLAHWLDTEHFTPLKNAEPISQHTGIRATTQDHLPVCGPIINQAQFNTDYQDLHHGRHWQNYPPAQPIENLYLLSGLGSRGFTAAPLLADYLLSMITGQPLPLEADLCKIIHPNRFNHRNLKKAQTEN